MAFTIAGAALDPHNGLATDGLTCDAFNEETWFPSSSPVANTAEPGSPDGTDTSGLAGDSGVPGQFLITVPTSGSYWVAIYNSWDPTVIDWVKAISASTYESAGMDAGGRSRHAQPPDRHRPPSRLAAMVCPCRPERSMSPPPPDFPSEWFHRHAYLGAGGGLTVVQYTGTSGGTTSPDARVAPGHVAAPASWCSPAYQNGNNRRLGYADVQLQCQRIERLRHCLSGISRRSAARGSSVCDSGHPVRNASPALIDALHSATLPVDPLGWYGVLPTAARDRARRVLDALD